MNRIELPAPPRRILIIKPSSLGDVTHALPVLGLLRRRWPDAQVSWVVAPMYAGLLEGLRGLDEVILFDRRRFGTAWRDLGAGVDLVRFKQDLRRRRFDLVIDLQGLLRSGWLAWLTRAPVRVGFANARELAWAFYTHRVHVGTMQQHALQRYLRVAEALGCPTSPIEFQFPVTDADRRHIDRVLGDVRRFAVLLPAANWPTKRWPIEYFASLAGPLRQRLGLASVVAGGPDSVELARRIPAALNLAGNTTLPQLVALFERADLVIANDSGPMHIAAALHRPLVALFGPTSPLRTGPFGREDSVLRLDMPCSPCFSRRCSHQSCLRWLNVDAVLRLAEAQLAKYALRTAASSA
jgi:heptosyltransferase-1